MNSTNTNQLVAKLIDRIDKNPDNYHNYYNLSVVLVELHDYDQAEELLLKSIKLFENNNNALNTFNFGLGNLYYILSDYNRAIAFLLRVTDKKLQIDSFQLLAQIYLQLKQYKRAISFANLVYEKKKNDPDILELLGDIYLSEGDFDKSIYFYKKALCFKKTAKLYLNMSLLYKLKNNIDDSKVYIKKAKKLDISYVNRKINLINDLGEFLNNKGI